MTLETIETKRKRLLFRSDHRGTKEMDLFLGSFAKKHLSAFDETQLALYEELLNLPDLDIYNWITGRADVPANQRNPVIELLLTHRFCTS